MSNKKIIIVILLFILGVFSISISTGNFFLTTEYYKTPIEAYNVDGSYNAVYGDTSVKREVGLISLDNNTCLFIGEIDKNNFVVSELDVKNDKYSSKGIRYFYDSNEMLNNLEVNLTKLSTGYVNWSILNKSDAESVANAFSTKSFTLSNGKEFYLAWLKTEDSSLS